MRHLLQNEVLATLQRPPNLEDFQDSQACTLGSPIPFFNLLDTILLKTGLACVHDLHFAYCLSVPQHSVHTQYALQS